MTFKDLITNLPSKDLWTYLSETDKPIIMYGMGNGADKICDVLGAYNVEISDFFASDGFVRGQIFHNKKVLSFSEIKEKYSDFIVLVSFGTKLDEVIDQIVNISQQCELYLPDVPVAGTQIFNLDFFNQNATDIEKAFGLLFDDYSKELFANVINYKLSGKIEYLLNLTEDTVESMKKVFKPSDWEAFLDLGAYNGDTIKETLELSPSLSDIIAFEPDTRNFKKLQAYLDDINVNSEAHNVCAWDKKDKLIFESSGNRNSTLSSLNHTASVGDTKKIIIESDSVDNVLNGRKIDYINYDVEGAESRAIDGSVETLKKWKPDLLIAAYHRSEDIFSLVIKLSEILPEHQLYLRRKRCFPAWELNIFATKNKG